MPSPIPPNAASFRTANQRGAARLAAVQALYQMDVGRQTLEDTLSQFSAHMLGREVEGEQYLPADADFFRQIVTGVIKSQLDIDPSIDKALSADWPVGADRCDAARHPALRRVRTAAPPRHSAGRGDHRICRYRQGVLRGRRAGPGERRARHHRQAASPTPEARQSAKRRSQPGISCCSLTRHSDGACIIGGTCAIARRCGSDRFDQRLMKLLSSP